MTETKIPLPTDRSITQVFSSSVALLVATPLMAPALSAELLNGLFDLTPAEARVASLIASGRSVREVAGQLGIAEQTVRSLLKRVFAKLGVSRQNELALLGRLAPR